MGFNSGFKGLIYNSKNIQHKSDSVMNGTTIYVQCNTEELSHNTFCRREAVGI